MLLFITCLEARRGCGESGAYGMDDVTNNERRTTFNILHVVSRLPVGGVENMLMKVVTGYDKDRFHASICCIKDGGEIADALTDLGYRVEVLGRMKGHGIDLGAIAAIYKQIKKENIHILRTHQYHANFYGRIAGVLAGVPVIIPSFHSRYICPRKPKIHRRIFDHFLSFVSDALVAVSTAVYSDIVKYDKVTPAKIRVIYNGIKIDNFKSGIPAIENRQQMHLPVDAFIIGSVGRLKEEKGHKYLLEAVSELNNVCVALAGDGPLRDELKRYAEKLGVPCVFTGMLPPDKIPTFLGSLDVFCFPSLWEGFPSALIEAMAAGLPVVASDIPSNQEIAGEAALFVSPRSKASLVVQLRRLLENQSLRSQMGERAAEQITKLSIENTINAYQDLFEEILRKKGMF